jgi:hypothetical protein
MVFIGPRFCVAAFVSTLPLSIIVRLCRDIFGKVLRREWRGRAAIGSFRVGRMGLRRG